MRHIIALLLTLLAMPAQAEKASLAELSQYLNTIDTAVTSFTQVNNDGSRSTGTVYINRPGRIRFEYDPPADDTLVIASGGQVAIFDGKTDSRPEQYPLRRTPLNILLQANIDLTRVSMVTGHGEQDGQTIVQAQDPDHPEYGRIYMYFDRNPLRLAQWLIVSESGEHTRVVLGPFQDRNSLSSGLFNTKLIADSRR